MSTILENTANTNVLYLDKNIEQSVVLEGLTWDSYTRFLEAFPESHAVHFAYDKGKLEIMTLSYEHENYNRLLADIFTNIALEFGIEYTNAGSVTLQREDLKKGFEPDSSFYVENEPLIRGKKRIILPNDPPPDLTIEIDIKSSSLDRMGIFAEIGINEVWRFDGEKFEILILNQNKQYRKSFESNVLPNVTSNLLLSFIEESFELPHSVLIRKVRNWARNR